MVWVGSSESRERGTHGEECTWGSAAVLRGCFHPAELSGDLEAVTGAAAAQVFEGQEEVALYLLEGGGSFQTSVAS